MTRRRLWWAAGVVLLVIVVTVGLGVAFWPERGEPGDCDELLELRDQQLSEPITRGDPTIAVIGDSYTQGSGLGGGPDAAWPAALGERLGAEVVVDGVGSTGFTTAGFCYLAGVTYGQRLDTDPPDADVVVVQGGVNDAIFGQPQEVAAAAADILGELADAPLVVVVGPPPVPGAEAATISTIDAGLRQATEGAGRTYVSLIDAGVELLDDGVHPTEAGQQRIAELVAAAMASAVGSG